MLQRNTMKFGKSKAPKAAPAESDSAIRRRERALFTDNMIRERMARVRKEVIDAVSEVLRSRGLRPSDIGAAHTSVESVLTSIEVNIGFEDIVVAVIAGLERTGELHLPIVDIEDKVSQEIDRLLAHPDSMATSAMAIDPLA